jgi:CheY-like chemotaxis protein
MRCLVLDDDFLIALDVQQILESAGAASVICVGSIADARAALQNEPAFSVAVLDIGIDGDGKERDADMTIAVLLQERGTPFIFLTGMGGDDARARKFPQAPLVDKPFQAGELLAALRRALRQR